MDFQDVPDFCRTRFWDYSPQKSVGNFEEMDGIPASVPDRMCVLQLQLLCLSSWAWAYFTLAKVGYEYQSSRDLWAGWRTQEEDHKDAVSRTEPRLRSQYKLLVHLWSKLDTCSVHSCGGAMWQLRSHLILQLTAIYSILHKASNSWKSWVFTIAAQSP